MLKKFFISFTKNKKSSKNSNQCSPRSKFTGKIKRDKQLLRDTFKDCDDVKFKKLVIPAMDMRQCVVAYVEGLVNVNALNRDVINRLVSQQPHKVDDITELLAIGETSVFNCADDMASKVLAGKVGILVDGIPRVLTVDSQEWPMRAIDEPLQERLIRGPREGFIEISQVNLGLIRRRLPDPN